MKQVNYTINSIQEFNKALDFLISLPEYQKASSVAAVVSLGDGDQNFARELFQIHEQKSIKGFICGFSTFGQVCNGKYSFTDRVISFFIFSSAKAALSFYDTEKIPVKEAAKDFSQKLDNDKETKCVQIFLNSLQIQDQELFIDSLNYKNREIKFAGGSASKDWTKINDEPIFLFAGSEQAIKGIILIAYSGQELFAEVKVELGWIPVGTEHYVTKVKGSKKVSQIDGMSIPQIYKKYFGIEDDKYFAQNAMSFPWLIERDGYLIARGIGLYDQDKNLIFPYNIKEGEKFFFSFGSMARIMEHTAKYTRKLIPMQMQAIYLTICGYRKQYFGEGEQTEINYFKEACPSVSGMAANGEIANLGDKVRILNCCTVMLAMREGIPAEEIASYPIPEPEKIHGEIPIIDKIYSFLKTTSKEYAEFREREKEKELKKRIEIERSANIAKSAFLSNMSHEIRTPINAILGMNEMILREEKNSQILEYAENIQDAGSTLLSLINDILDFSKIEAGKLEIINSSYSLSSLLNDLLIMTEVKARAKALTLSFIIDSEVPDALEGDMLRIRQVLINILTNAIKYTKKGSVRLNLSFKKIDEEYADFTFHVIDTGIGIKDVDLKKLCSPFVRIEEKRNSSIEGTGLGMSITKHLLEMMASKLQVKSDYGQGSDFYFTIKQKVKKWTAMGDFVKKARAKNLTEKENKKLFTAEKANILVVDDTAVNLTVIRNLLKRTKIKVSTCLSGQESISEAKEKKFDIIFMDHRMPVMDGCEALKKIRALGPKSPNYKSPIIVLTANAVRGMKEKFLKEGFDDYISKPVSPEELEAMIKKWLPKEKITETSSPIYGGLLKKTEAFRNFIINNGTFKKKISLLKEIDFNSGMNYCGDTDSYMATIKDFTNDSAANIQILEDSLQNEDIKNFTIKVHALKSSARLIGAVKLSQDAALLESYGDQNNIQQIKEKAPELLSSYKKLVTKIKEFLPTENLLIIHKEELEEAYSGLSECINAEDFNSAKSIIELLEKYKISGEEEIKIKKIKKYIILQNKEEVKKLLIEPVVI